MKMTSTPYYASNIAIDIAGATDPCGRLYDGWCR